MPRMLWEVVLISLGSSSCMSFALLTLVYFGSLAMAVVGLE